MGKNTGVDGGKTIMRIQTGSIWKDDNTGRKYIILNVEKDADGSILNIKIQNVNNAGAIFDLGEWELKNNYTKIDDFFSSLKRG